MTTFKGGIHPYEGKDLSKDQPVQKILPKGDLVFPMQQHIGKPAEPIVSVGDQVLMGQKIGEASGVVSACVISSVSGKVKAIEARLVSDGSKVNSVVIENDHQYTPIQKLGDKRAYQSLSKNAIRDIIKDAGIVGMGGAGFPTHVKLSPKDEKKIDYVIINGSECEPYLTSDYRMMLEEPQRIIEGLKIELQLFDNAKGILAIEDNKPEAIQKLEGLLKEEPKIELVKLKTKYPQGAERMLIYAVTGRKINSKMLPADAGCIVSNIDTAIAIQMAVAESTPLMRRIVTVSGLGIKKPGNFNVLTGTSYQELIEAAGGFLDTPEKIISGGPMMGKALYSTDIPVTKTSSALLVLGAEESEFYEPSSCIRCGRCVDVCPEQIVPQKLMEFALNNNVDSFVSHDGMECCECGCCTFVCPAKRRLTQAFHYMKQTVAASKR